LKVQTEITAAAIVYPASSNSSAEKIICAFIKNLSSDQPHFFHLKPSKPSSSTAACLSLSIDRPAPTYLSYFPT
jgi:hypothetical protein